MASSDTRKESSRGEVRSQLLNIIRSLMEVRLLIYHKDLTWTENGEELLLNGRLQVIF